MDAARLQLTDLRLDAEYVVLTLLPPDAFELAVALRALLRHPTGALRAGRATRSIDVAAGLTLLHPDGSAEPFEPPEAPPVPLQDQLKQAARHGGAALLDGVSSLGRAAGVKLPGAGGGAAARARAGAGRANASGEDGGGGGDGEEQEDEESSTALLALVAVALMAGCCGCGCCLLCFASRRRRRGKRHSRSRHAEEEEKQSFLAMSPSEYDALGGENGRHDRGSMLLGESRVDLRL